MVSDAVTLASSVAYVIAFALAAMGFYTLCAPRNLIKRIAGLAILQGALCLFFAVIGAQIGARAPTLDLDETPYAQAYANPLPHAQMVGATIAGSAALLFALALVVRIREAYGSIEDDEIDGADDAQDKAERSA